MCAQEITPERPWHAKFLREWFLVITKVSCNEARPQPLHFPVNYSCDHVGGGCNPLKSANMLCGDHVLKPLFQNKREPNVLGLAALTSGLRETKFSLTPLPHVGGHVCEFSFEGSASVLLSWPASFCKPQLLRSSMQGSVCWQSTLACDCYVEILLTCFHGAETVCSQSRKCVIKDWV